MSAFRRPGVLLGLLLVPVLLVSGLLVGAAAGDTPAAPVTPAVVPASVVLPGAASASRTVPRLASGIVAAPAADTAGDAIAAVATHLPPCAITARACVDLSAHKAWVTDGAGRILYGPVSVLGGRPGEPTPLGTFRVSNKVVDYHSRQFDAPMPYSVFFYPGVAFHTGSLSRQSAGCLHLSNRSAQRFFALLAPGDPVQVIR